MKHSMLYAALVCTTSSLLAQFPSQIKNVVVIVQENRTPDNLFHFLSPTCPIPRGASGLSACTPYPVTSGCYNISPCGLSNKNGASVPVTLKSMPLGQSTDPNHSHKGFVEMCDADPKTLACRNDGAWKTSSGSYSYVSNPSVTNSDGSKGHAIDPYLQLAQQYGWANYMFQSNQGPSYPAHQFIFSGTSALTAADDANSVFLAENPNLKVSSKEAGCLALSTGTNSVVSPVLNGPKAGCTQDANNSTEECPLDNKALVYPTNPVGAFCVTHQTMADILDQRSITWKYYAMSAGFLWTAPNAVQAICQPQWIHPSGDPSSGLECTGDEWKAKVDYNSKGTDILRDIANCNLAKVSWVTPNGPWSDHQAPDGPSWVAAIVNAIGNSSTCPGGTADAGESYWKNTAILLTWDDWGGWSDHEPPPSAGNLPCISSNCPADYQYGFRVPLVVISAYTPAGYIDNNQHDFGSILRMIEGINAIPEGALGFADQRSTTDLEEFFSLTQRRSFVTIPAEKGASYFLNFKGAALAPDSD